MSREETAPLLRTASPHPGTTISRTAGSGLQQWFNSPPPALRAALVAYSLLALVDIGFLALVPLFFASASQAGGIGLPASTIGTLMVCSDLSYPSAFRANTAVVAGDYVNHQCPRPGSPLSKATQAFRGAPVVYHWRFCLLCHVADLDCDLGFRCVCVSKV